MAQVQKGIGAGKRGSKEAQIILLFSMLETQTFRSNHNNVFVCLGMNIKSRALKFYHSVDNGILGYPCNNKSPSYLRQYSGAKKFGAMVKLLFSTLDLALGPRAVYVRFNKRWEIV